MTITLEPQTIPVSTDWSAVADEIGAVLARTAARYDRMGDINAAAFAKLRESGLTSAIVPVEFGGGGASHAELGAALRTLARHDPSTAVTLAMHTHVVATQVWRHNHGMDAEKILRKVVDERAILVTSGASDWTGSSGEATRVDGGYRVSARKTPVSGCEVGDVLVTSIRWSGGPDGAQVLHCSVPMRAEGVSIDRTWDTVGLRATGSHTVVLDNVFVPDAAVSLQRPADQWHPIWNIVLGAAMPLIMAAYLGIADAAVDAARVLVGARHDAVTFQGLGEMLNAHTTADDVVAMMFVDSDNLQYAATDEHASRTLIRKTVAAGAIIGAVRLAAEVAGGAAFSRGCDLERLERDVHGCNLHPLPRAKQTQFTGRVALGLSPVA